MVTLGVSGCLTADLKPELQVTVCIRCGDWVGLFSRPAWMTVWMTWWRDGKWLNDLLTSHTYLLPGWMHMGVAGGYYRLLLLLPSVVSGRKREGEESQNAAMDI